MAEQHSKAGAFAEPPHSVLTDEPVQHPCCEWCLQVLLDAWYPLWQVVIQPALGVLMLGAVRMLLNIFSFMIQQVKHYSSTVDAASLRAGGQAEPVGSGL